MENITEYELAKNRCKEQYIRESFGSKQQLSHWEEKAFDYAFRNAYKEGMAYVQRSMPSEPQSTSTLLVDDDTHLAGTILHGLLREGYKGQSAIDLAVHYTSALKTALNKNK